VPRDGAIIAANLIGKLDHKLTRNHLFMLRAKNQKTLATAANTFDYLL